MVTFSVQFDDTDLLGALGRLQAGLADTAPLMNLLGAYGRDSTRRRWQSQEAPDGTAWAPLLPAYASMKPSGYGLLYLSGALEASISYAAGADVAEWGSPVIYAAVHQFGATIVPKSARALSFRLGLGGVIRVHVKSVTIPARPYLGFSAEDRAEIPLLAEDYMARLLR